MSYARVETSVRTNEKFLQAGAAASWLWLCGLLYCQEGLTDGFIPEAAIPYLGVPNPRPLTRRLEGARLWDPVDGGWRVHGYLKHNRSASTVQAIRDERRAAGTRGGEASGEARRKQVASTDAKQAANPTTDTATETTTKQKTLSALRASFDRFWAVYPRKFGKDGAWRIWQRLRPDEDAVSAIVSAVESQARGWTDPQFIPHPKTWLHNGRWKDEAAPVQSNRSVPVSHAGTWWGCPHQPQCGSLQACEALKREAS